MVAHGKQTDAEFNKEPVRENLANGHPDSPVPYETYDCSGNRRSASSTSNDKRETSNTFGQQGYLQEEKKLLA